MLRHPRPPLRLLALSAALLAASACRRSGPPPERYLPARSAGVIVVPELRRATKELGALQEMASAFPGSAQLPELRRSLAAQLGFDPLDPDGLSKAGIDPKRGLAVGVEPASAGAPAPWTSPVVVLPVRDAGALRETIGRIARERLGAVRAGSVAAGAAAGGPEVAIYASSAGPGGPVLALGFGEGEKLAVLAAGAGAPDAVRAALTLQPEGSLDQAPGWRELRKTLGDRYALLFAFLPPPRAENPLPVDQAVVLGLGAASGTVRLGALARVAPATAAALSGSGDARALVGALSAEAPLVLRWDGDPAALGRAIVPRIPETDRRWLGDRGLDLQRDLFDVLAPGAAASISLSPRLDLSDVSDVALRADPLRLVSFELAADVKDEAAAGRTLARLPALFAALQAPAGPVTPGTADPAGREGRIPTASGEVAWRLDGKRLRMVGGPPGALDALLARKPGAGWTAPSKDAAAALAGGLGGAVLAPDRLVKSVRALPDDAFGSGPFGFVLRGMVERYLEGLETIRSASLRAERVDQGILVELRIEVPPAREGKP